MGFLLLRLAIFLYDFHARQYDAQIGRFWGIDPADQFPSGYTGMGNDPASGVDPTGMVTSGAGNMNTEIRATEIHSVIEGSLDFYQWSDELKTPGGSGGVEVVDVPSQTIVYYYQNGVSGGGEEQKEEKGLLDRIKDTYKRIDNAVTEAVYSNAVGSAVMYNFVIPFNESVNPVYGVVNGVYGASTGKDFTWGTPVNKTASGVSLAFAFIPGITLEKAALQTGERAVANVMANGSKAAAKTLALQGEELVLANGGKNSITLRTISRQIRYDLAGKSHGGVPTPHMQIYKKHFVNGTVRSVTRESKKAIPLTQQEIRMIRKYLQRTLKNHN